HPYFAVDFGGPASCDAAEIWPVGPVGIPSGEAPQARKSEGLPGETFTIFLSDWHRGTARCDGGAEITITAGPELPHIVAHRTPAYL
uniref:hypothetical protein n=1 Tax=Salmonella sp. SAL4433 TaxID=3159888 RepID=UPI00397CC92F